MFSTGDAVDVIISFTIVDSLPCVKPGALGLFRPDRVDISPVSLPDTDRPRLLQHHQNRGRHLTLLQGPGRAETAPAKTQETAKKFRPNCC